MRVNNTEVTALVELWVSVRSYVPLKDQRQCAEQFIATIDEAELIDLSIPNPELYGICDIFDNALRIHCRENGYDEMDMSDWDE
jgi:hypothetical protein